MKILLLYNKKNAPPWNASILIEKELKKKHQVEFFDLGQTPYWTDFYGKLPFYFPKGFPVSVQSVTKKSGSKFDLVIIIDAPGQYRLTGLKKLNIPRVLWSFDTPEPDCFRFHNYFKNDYSHIFTVHKDLIHKFGSECKWLPGFCDPEIHKKYNLPKIYDIVFIGNLNLEGINAQLYSKRIELLKLLGEKFNLKVFSGIYGQEMARIYSQSKIVFNKSRRDDLNFRIFEAMACGSLLITDRPRPEVGLEEFFQDGKHLILYNNEKDLIEKVDYYLKHEKEREEIALAGYKEVLEKHTIEHRTTQMLKIVFNNIDTA